MASRGTKLRHLLIEMSCPFALALGTPGQGFHSTRILGLALYDIIGTILLAMITSLIFKTDLFKNILGWFIVGEILHYVYGTQTAFLAYINMTPQCLSK